MKKALPLLIVLVLLIIFSFIITLSGKRKGKPGYILSLKREPSAFIIKTSEDSVILKKEGETWFVIKGDIKVKTDSFQMANLMNKLKELRGDIVSKNPDKFSIYEVTGDKATTLTILLNNDTLKLHVGKRGPDFTTCYVKPGDENKVYLASINLKPILKTDLKRWRNKKILYFEPENVYKLTYYYPRDTFEIVRTDTGFYSQEIAELDTQAVNSAIRSLSRFSAYEFADTVKPEEAGFKNPKLKLVVEFTDGRETTIIIGKKRDEYKYYVKKEGDRSVYLPSKYVVEKFMKKREDFKKKVKEEVKKNKKK